MPKEYNIQSIINVSNLYEYQVAEENDVANKNVEVDLFSQITKKRLNRKKYQMRIFLEDTSDDTPYKWYLG